MYLFLQLNFPLFFGFCDKTLVTFLEKPVSVSMAN